MIKLALKRRSSGRNSTARAGFWSGGGKLDAQMLTDQLNELGGQGWELVSVFDTTKLEGQTRQVYAVMKRAR